MYIGQKVKCLVFLPNFNQVLEFVNRYSQKAPVHNYMEICPMGAALIHSDRSKERWADRTKLIGDFCTYAQAPKK